MQWVSKVWAVRDRGERGRGGEIDVRLICCCQSVYCWGWLAGKKCYREFKSWLKTEIKVWLVGILVVVLVMLMQKKVWSWSSKLWFQTLLLSFTECWSGLFQNVKSAVKMMWRQGQKLSIKHQSAMINYNGWGMNAEFWNKDSSQWILNRSSTDFVAVAANARELQSQFRLFSFAYDDGEVISWVRVCV